MVKQVDLTPEELSEALSSPIDKKILLSILQKFTDNGLTYKIRTKWKPENDISPDDYRVFCYIKKSKEALIINTSAYNTNTFLLQVRILDRSTFDRLDDYTENIRNQIVNAPYNCKNCGCSDKAYIFTYKNHTYRKCHMICGNFSLCNFAQEDVDSIMDIINREIIFGKPKHAK